MRVLVTGGRNFADRDQLFEVFDNLHADTPITLIIEGGAYGADRLSRDWAKARGVPFQTYEADWPNEGNPEICVAFAGGIGTANMVRRAKAARVYVEVVPVKNTCDHVNPGKWTHKKDAKGNTIAVCPSCGRYMGNVLDKGTL